MGDIMRHHRRSIRLKEYDYSQPGDYFITICTHNRECLFGEIVNGKMQLTPIGLIVEDEWKRTPLIRNNVELGPFVIMPNHLHGIIILNDNGRGELPFAPTNKTPFVPAKNTRTGKFVSPSNTIGAIVRGFKSASTKRINEMRGTPGVPVWQRNYYEHIIRDEKNYYNICEYIDNNPLQWWLDRENPDEREKQNIPLSKDEPWQI
jgi:REP element-mobilizing transposase RayT